VDWSEEIDLRQRGQETLWGIVLEVLSSVLMPLHASALMPLNDRQAECGMP